MPNTPTVQLLALVAANIMLVGGALIVYRRFTGWGPAALSAFGLVLLVLLGARRQAPMLPAAVAAWIVGAYWFTASTSFANPAVTLARALSDSFAGIAPAHAPAFIAAQFVGMALALAAERVVAR